MSAVDPILGDYLALNLGETFDELHFEKQLIIPCNCMFQTKTEQT